MWACPPQNVTSLAAQHHIVNKIENGNSFVPTAPESLVLDASVLSPFASSLQFETEINVTWIGASECQVDYMKSFQSELSTLLEKVRWYQGSDYYEGNLKDFMTEAEQITVQKDYFKSGLQVGITEEQVSVF